jgi:hypothetical protein
VAIIAGFPVRITSWTPPRAFGSGGYLRRIDVGNRQPLQLSRRIDDVDGAPVRNLRDGESRHSGQRLFVVEGSRQDRRRIGQERRLPPRGFGGVAPDPQLIVQIRRRDCGRCEVRQCLSRLDIHVAEGTRRPIVEHERPRTFGAEPHRADEHRTDPLFAVGGQLLFEHRLGGHVRHR